MEPKDVSFYLSNDTSLYNNKSGKFVCSRWEIGSSIKDELFVPRLEKNESVKYSNLESSVTEQGQKIKTILAKYDSQKAESIFFLCGTSLFFEREKTSFHDSIKRAREAEKEFKNRAKNWRNPEDVKELTEVDFIFFRHYARSSSSRLTGDKAVIEALFQDMKTKTRTLQFRNSVYRLVNLLCKKEPSLKLEDSEPTMTLEQLKKYHSDANYKIIAACKEARRLLKLFLINTRDSNEVQNIYYNWGKKLSKEKL